MNVETTRVGHAGWRRFRLASFHTPAQPVKVPRIGILWHAANADEESDYLPLVEEAFAGLGYVAGKTIELQRRFPAEQPSDSGRWRGIE